MVIYFGWIMAFPNAEGPHIVCYSGIVPIPIHVGWVHDGKIEPRNGAIIYQNTKGYWVVIVGNCVGIGKWERIR